MMLPSFAFSLISADFSSKTPCFDLFLRILPRFLPCFLNQFMVFDLCNQFCFVHFSCFILKTIHGVISNMDIYDARIESPAVLHFYHPDIFDIQDGAEWEFVPCGYRVIRNGCCARCGVIVFPAALIVGIGGHPIITDIFRALWDGCQYRYGYKHRH